MAVAQHTLTLDQFLKLPEEKPALEYWDGVITRKVSPLPDHGAAQLIVGELFNSFARPRRLGLAFSETRFAKRPRYSPVPDVSFYLRERIHLITDGYEFLSEPPDIAVEILSPGQRVNRLIQKCQAYLEMSSRIALLINTGDRSVRELHPGRPIRVLRGDDRIDLDDVLPGFELTVSGLFDAVFPAWLRDADAPSI